MENRSLPEGFASVRVALIGGERSRVTQGAIGGLGAGKVLPSATELGDATLKTAQRSPESPRVSVMIDLISVTRRLGLLFASVAVEHPGYS